MLDIVLHKKLHAAEGDMQLHINLQVTDGAFISLYGPSGAGKTSILRMLAGLLKPDDGYIKTTGLTWFDAAGKINIPPQQRNIGFVFQDYALFPNMNVRENIAFALSQKDHKAVNELLELTGLEALASRKTDTLSGGQKQRVALARAIARKPQLLLLDEPLSAIDSAMRLQLQTTLQAIHKRFGLTTILVSHDMEEIIRLCGEVIHLEGGTVQQRATPSIFFAQRQNDNGLAGYITAIEPGNGGSTITVLLATRIVTVSVPATGHYATGDRVQLSFDKNEPRLSKI